MYIFVNVNSPHDLETQGNKLLCEMLVFEEGDCEAW